MPPFSSADHQISLYVRADELTGDSIEEVVELVGRLGRTDARGLSARPCPAYLSRFLSNSTAHPC